ncbi:outer membrane receptor protein [Caulobacter sp. AP07]|uniref:TonB-dependent receptor plug domain-containing protein n=1 Tax=Caulobacter sp. AP07 TaxID=1144304 RepID=UPI000271D9DC|nr:TonB-dependent receptor plug domain-containing protein [Caulobacter sp. AP07]EJL33302.1 outer membrane receptor protein [Caulobacter sp. AP07]
MIARHKTLLAAALAATSATTPALAAQDPVTPYAAAYFADAQPYSAFDMLSRLPGFTFNGGDSDVRGFSGATGNVLIDGQRPTGKSESLETVLRRIPARAVVRIELIRAGAPGVDMQGRGLIANVVRARETTTRGRLETSSAFHPGAVAPKLAGELSRRRGDRLLEASASAERTVDDEKGQGPRIWTRPDGSVQRDAVYREDKGARLAQAAVGHERPVLGGKLRLDVNLRDEITRANIRETERRPGPSIETVVEREDVGEVEIGGRFERALTSRWKLEALALHHATRTRAGDHALEGAETSATRLNAEAAETIARALARREAPGLTVELGGEAALNVLDSRSALEENGVAIALPSANVRVEERRGEVFATAAWRARPTLTIEAGARIEASRLRQTGDSQLEKTFLYPKPRLLVTWARDEHHQLRLELERRVGQLDFEDFVSSTSLTSNTVTAGNPDLEPDKTWRLAATWERRFGKAGAIVLTVRHDEIADAVDRVPIVGPGYAFDAPGNIGHATRDEIELNASLPLEAVIPGGLLHADVTARRSCVIDPAPDGRRGLSDAPSVGGALHFTQDLPVRKMRWGVDLVLAEEKREYRFDEVRTDRVEARWSAFVESRPAPAWNLRLEVDNLTRGKVDRRREQYAGLRGAAALKRIETRSLDHGAFAGVTLQRSFGG